MQTDLNAFTSSIKASKRKASLSIMKHTNSSININKLLLLECLIILNIFSSVKVLNMIDVGSFTIEGIEEKLMNHNLTRSEHLNQNAS
jgi:hypothetical protein